MLTANDHLSVHRDAPPSITGPRIETVCAGAPCAANAGLLGRDKSLERRLRRQRRRARSAVRGGQGWSIGLW